MRTLKVTTFLTLDGVMQAPGGPEEDPSGGFTHGGWSVNYWNDQLSQEMAEFMGHRFEMLLGRKTYEIFAGYWPYSIEPGAEALNLARKHVASTTLRSVDWNNSTQIKGDVPAYVSNLKTALRARTSSARQRAANTDTAAARPRRRVPPHDLPARARQREASFCRRHRAGGVHER